MKILFSPTSPYVRKCLVTAHELGLHDRIQLLPSNAHPVQRDRNIIGSNPLGKVPTFFTDDGQVLYDSRVICEYLNDLGRGTLLPASGAPRWETLTLQSLGTASWIAGLLARTKMSRGPSPCAGRNGAQGSLTRRRLRCATSRAGPHCCSAWTSGPSRSAAHCGISTSDSPTSRGGTASAPWRSGTPRSRSVRASARSGRCELLAGARDGAGNDFRSRPRSSRAGAT